MLSEQYILPYHREIDVTLFAGGGGSCTGIERATGKFVDIAINHNPKALGMHEANHPQTKHLCSDVFEVDPMEATEGRKVRLLWASPDCKHFSIAKGGKPLDKKIRSLAWVVVKWAKKVHPRIIIVENVKEFQTWGPLGKDNLPIPDKKGEIFNIWVEALRKLGYKVEWKELVACDYGAPTSRKRFFLIARSDGLPIVWPEPTYGDPKKEDTKKRKLKPWRTAAECIDWSIPCPSIFERNKPLSDNTLRRIAKGIIKYVIDEKSPFIVSCANWSSDSIKSIESPLTTVTSNPKGGHHAIVSPTLIQVGYGETSGQNPRVLDLDKPLGTIVSGGNKFALVSAFLAKHYTGVIGSSLEEPIGTVTTIDHHSLVTSCLVKMRNNQDAQDIREPISTITSGGTHHGEVRALLIKYYGNEKGGFSLSEPIDTIPTKDRFGLVTVNIAGEIYAISDIGFRMLQPHELYKAQGFDKYIFDRTADGTKLTKTEQVHMCGNVVCPPQAEAVVAAQLSVEDELHKVI